MSAERFQWMESTIVDLVARVQTLNAKLTALDQSNAHGWINSGTASPSTAAGGIFYIQPVAIGAGGSVANQTIYRLINGSATVVISATVYNVMAVPTVATAGKNITVGANGDGTYLAISQSC
jgi:hypothetical protein